MAQSPVKRIAWEWEMVVFSLVGIAMLAVIGLGASRYLNALKEKPLPLRGAVKASSRFNSNALAFITPESMPLNGRNAFKTVTPPGWRAPRSNRNRRDWTRRNRNPDQDNQQTTQNQNTSIATRTPPPVPQPPPVPPDRHFVTYKGFIIASDGTQQAYVGYRFVPGQGTPSSRSLFVSTGEQALDGAVVVRGFNDESLTIEIPGHGAVTINKGNEQQVDF
tara:strand:+ start:788 stop:1447 length:660 start_codon:yes stop_codon:yes gene_type:complete